jgi:hypothetical protein
MGFCRALPFSSRRKPRVIAGLGARPVQTRYTLGTFRVQITRIAVPCAAGVLARDRPRFRRSPSAGRSGSAAPVPWHPARPTSHSATLAAWSIGKFRDGNGLEAGTAPPLCGRQ